MLPPIAALRFASDVRAGDVDTRPVDVWFQTVASGFAARQLLTLRRLVIAAAQPPRRADLGDDINRYRALGAEQSASNVEIHAAWRAHIKLLHSDRNSGSDATDLAAAVNEAITVLRPHPSSTSVWSFHASSTSQCASRATVTRSTSISNWNGNDTPVTVERLRKQRAAGFLGFTSPPRPDATQQPQLPRSAP